MTFTISWWILSLGLLFAPIIYAALRKPDGGYFDLQIDTLLWFAVCWPSAIAIAVGHFIK